MIRNNNPGNIRASKDTWLGKTGQDSRGFVVFDTLPHGYRALYKLLDNYIKKGYDTIDKVINKYAPPTENETEIYINHVVSWTGIARYQKLTKADLYSLGLAISRQEHGTVDVEAAKNGLSLIYRDDAKPPGMGGIPVVLLIMGLGLLLYKR